ncbi:Smr/MutS family protein [Desulforegula conservatrix]|uniref:Smr/MutS family protein n=1 Tax=Desulforegula conservatrix TaxID=153026 RepID=UPI0004009B77|nr:Smr/MutS family protein [Desulforegula conservatrix]
MDDFDINDDEAIIVPITDEIDLHNFRPKDVKELLEDYFQACIEKGILSVRVIHGKGTGTLRKTVESFIAKSEMVKNFAYPAPGYAGGWGATLVELKVALNKQP